MKNCIKAECDIWLLRDIKLQRYLTYVLTIPAHGICAAEIEICAFVCNRSLDVNISKGFTCHS